MNAGSSCDKCWCLSLLDFSYLTCHLEDPGIGVALCHLNITDTNIGVVTKRLLHQQVKILGYFSCHVCTGKCVPTAVSGVDISEVPGCHLLQQMSSQWGSQKLLQGLLSRELTAYLSIINQFKLNELWPYYQKHVNQMILNHTTL